MFSNVFQLLDYTLRVEKKSDNTIKYVNFYIDTFNIMQVSIVSILFRITSVPLQSLASIGLCCEH